MGLNTNFAPGILFDHAPVPQYGPNMIIPSPSSYEDGSTGVWPAGKEGLWTSGNTIPANCTIANSTAQAFDGTHSLALTYVSGGFMQAYSQFLTVTPGQPYTISGWFRAATAGRGINMIIGWTQPGGGSGSLGFTSPFVVNDTTTGWTQYIQGAVGGPNSTVAPPNASVAQVYCQILGLTTAGEIHYIDLLSLNPGVFYPP